jgi:hypothetical protein
MNLQSFESKIYESQKIYCITNLVGIHCKQLHKKFFEKNKIQELFRDSHT